MNDSKDLDEAIAPKFLSTCFEKIVALTQIANSFPEKDELGFYRRIPSCNQNIKNISSLIGEAMKILSDFGTDSHKVEPQKTVKYSDVVDVLDTYLENVDLTLDKIKDHTNQDKSLFVKDRPNQSNISDNSNEDKPQLRFKDPVDNSAEYPFVPKITKKFHSDIPLNEKILLAQHNKATFFQNIQNPPAYEFAHPYEEELNNLEYQDFQFELDVRTQQPVPFKPHTFMYVDNQTEFKTLLDDLRNQGIKEIAIDLEHHSYRSFQGFTCLMQLSTREKDYIIDTLSLRDSIQELNEIFTNPKIVKVLHGADMDIEWLQKDFGIYMVNMFDTGQASKFLQFPSAGLAYLLKEFCNVTANKEYQTADWRKRPLPKEMVKYAREDTHYLLYIYDELRKKIIAKAGESNSNPIESLKSILNKSKVICAKSYRKPKLKTDHYYDIMNRNRPILTTKKFKLLKVIYKWRDQTARTEDESTGFILPMNFVFEIMELNPKTPNEVYARIKRMNWPAKKHINELLEAIKAVNEGVTDSKKTPHEEMVLEKIPPPVQVANLQNKAFRPSFIDMELSQSEKFKIADENVGISFQKLDNQRGHGSAHDYHALFSVAKPAVTKDKKKHEDIKKSFNYGSFYDFTMTFNPNFKKDILILQQEHEKAARERRQQIAEKEQQINQANLENTEGFMEFAKEKGEAPSKKQGPTYSLGLDKETTVQKDNALPASLKEQYNVNVKANNKKQRNRNKSKNNKQIDQDAEKFNEQVKKIKTNIEEAKTAHKLENKYDLLVNNSSDEDEKVDGQALSKANRKAFNKFWEKNSRLDLEDPIQSLIRKETGKPLPQGKKKKVVHFKKNNYSRKGVQK